MRYTAPTGISKMEYKRRVFNTALCECFSRIHSRCLGITESVELYGYYPETNDRFLAEQASAMAKAFLRDTLNLDTATIRDTKKALSEANSFVQDCVELCEAIADEKMKTADKHDVEVTELDTPELNAEEKELINQLFNDKDPEIEADAVRDVTVKALLSERERANKIKEATSIAQKAGDANKLEESVIQLSTRGASSLMHALITSVSESTVRSVHAEYPQMRIGTILSENADRINTVASMVYVLYESANAFGIKRYAPNEIKALAKDIYEGK